MTAMLDYAIEAIDRGLSVVPIPPGQKYPRGMASWRDYQSRIMSHDEAEQWWTTNPDWGIAVITGAVSGLMALDADTQEAQDWLIKKGLASPVCVKTKRGWHHWYAYDVDNLIPTKAGIEIFDDDGEAINGLDGRGEGGLLLMPPTPNYEWKLAPGADLDELPVFRGFPPKPAPKGMMSIDLSGVDAAGAKSNAWEDAKSLAAKFPGGKIPTGGGNQRNQRLAKYVGERVAEGMTGAELKAKANQFMDTWFDDRLEDFQVDAMLRSVTTKDKREHGDRVERKAAERAAEGSTEATAEATVEAPAELAPLYTFDDTAAFEDKAKSEKYLIQPWLKKGGITQIFGYSGCGKSIFMLHMMTALANGRRYAGPFAIERQAKVLLFDYENSPRTLMRRVETMSLEHGGSPGKNLPMWVQSMGSSDNDIDIGEPEGRKAMVSYVEREEPDVVVIDTIRSSMPGQDENVKDGWVKLNRFTKALRNAGIGVVLLHHANKRSADSLTPIFAGSTHQLTDLDRQLILNQIFRSGETEKALARGGVEDKSGDGSVWDALASQLPDDDYRMQMVIKITYGKARDHDDDDDDEQYVGIARDNSPARRGEKFVSSVSTRQRAITMSSMGYGIDDIYKALDIPFEAVLRFLGLED